MTALARHPAEARDSRLWTADQFLEFYMTRPDGERWQLVDGLPMMMVPANKVHQRIARNLEHILDDALRTSRPDLMVYRELGVRIPGADDFNPEPDLAVVFADATYSYYENRFFAVAEVTSPSNTAEMIQRKLDLYRSHPDNLYCLTIDQDEVHIVLFSREDGWQRSDLRSPDLLRLPAFKFEARVATIYEGTPLAR